ncbi:germination protein YpeB [Paenibacillus eucommiae]|uniref:Spore germination protein n=1 Tax=Paenibacillus eucommiae TaxID=1355755 RepID=A0ABS4IMW0_9BACL|nr:germination protein YpeB [Paenibacillus eucommiae]MBP1988917.1 spore germination protein [Paenibacillus eucommiae]
MYKRLSIVMFPLVTLALIGASVWGYLEHQDKNKILIKAENQYQRAFHDLSYRMDRLHNELGNTLAVNSTSNDSYRKGLVNVWRLTSQAQSDISQLPLAMLPFNKTEEFLANLANLSYRTSVRDLNKSPLSQEELKTLGTLYEHSKELTGEIRGVQNKVITNNLRWMDVELALASKDEPVDNVIIDGFTTVDKKVEGYSEIEWGPGNLTVFQKNNVQMLSGNEMTTEEIKQKAAAFLNRSDVANFQVTENGNGGTEYQSYSVTASSGGKNEADIQMDYSKKGGQLIYFVKSREVSGANLDIRRARDAADEFLDQHGYKEMSAVSYDQDDSTANIVFVKRDKDILIYPQQVSVKVALDDGEILGVQAAEYVFSQKERKLAAPKISAEEGRKMLSPQMEISEQKLAVITNDLEQEVLCHEYTGKMNSNLYRIYINGETGNEEKIETIRPQDTQAAAK